jgi:hypothetical protein
VWDDLTLGTFTFLFFFLNWPPVPPESAFYSLQLVTLLTIFAIALNNT